MSDVKTESELFSEITKQINSVYSDYARSVGLSYTSLHTLHMVYLTENCTQKMIVDQTFLPKQTVHSVVKSFCDRGLMTLREMPDDRRNKTIHLTAKGRAFAKKILPQITEAESGSMAQFSARDRKAFLTFMQKYASAFKEALHR